MIKKCEICGNEFKTSVKINGIRKLLYHRRYCLVCSPWGQHNTRKLTGQEEQGYRICSKCKSKKPESEFHKKNKFHFHSHCKVCVYNLQKTRWKIRKIQAVDLFGGKCSICGYDKNIAALHFHHLDPSDKELDWNRLRLVSWSNVIKELKKCILVCSNCHSEIHNPDCSKNLMTDECNKFKYRNRLNIEIKPTGECPICNEAVYGTKYCCEEHSVIGRRKVVRPSKEQIKLDIAALPMTQIGLKYGVSDNAVRKWLKRYEIKGK